MTVKSLIEQIVEYKCKAVIVNGRRDDRITRLVCGMFIRRHVESGERKTGGRVIGLIRDSQSGLVTIENLAEANICQAKLDEIQGSIDADDVAVVMTSSESTGNEKNLFQYSHFSIINNCRSLGGVIDVDESAIYFDYSSFSRPGYSIFVSLSFGISAIYLDPSLLNNSDHVFAILEQEKVSFGTFSTHLLDCCCQKWAACEREILPNCLRYVLVRDVYLIDEEVIHYLRREQKTVVSLYTTDYTLVAATASRSYKDDDIQYRPLPGVQMKVVNGNGNVLPVEHPGLLMVRYNKYCLYLCI